MKTNSGHVNRTLKYVFFFKKKEVKNIYHKYIYNIFITIFKVLLICLYIFV